MVLSCKFVTVQIWFIEIGIKKNISTVFLQGSKHRLVHQDFVLFLE